MAKQNFNILYFSVVIIFLMFSLSYVFVPVYKIFCQVTGSGGYSAEFGDFLALYRNGNLFFLEEINYVKDLKYVYISFQTHVHDKLPLLFFSENTYIKIPVGKSTLVFFNLINFSEDTVVFSSTYNVIPTQVNSFFNKIQCFCFEDQVIEANQRVELPVFFSIDPTYLDDPTASKITNIILSYSIFKIII